MYWPAQIRRLGDLRIFAPDLPAHGKSGGIGHQRVEDYAEDLIDLLNGLHLNAAVWVGHSMGGAIALQAALQFPERVLALGLLATGARLRVDPAIVRAASHDDTFAAAVDMIGARSFGPSTPPRLKELALRRMADIRPSVLLGDLLACDAFDVMETLERVRVPTLILCGAQDRMTPPNYSEYLAQHIRGSQMQLAADAGHMLMLEQPDLVARALSGFVTSIPYEPGRL